MAKSTKSTAAAAHKLPPVSASQPQTTITVRLRRDVPRDDITAKKGDVIATITIPDGCGDLNFLADTIRNGVAGESDD